ncbi:MAG TPA: translation elongation factor Ts [Thermoleophilaceae bacterium]
MSTVEISAKDVKALRDRTGAGMMDCKAALQEAGGDVDKAVEILRVKGQAQAQKRSGRVASEGQVASYIHAGGRIGVLVEVNCETDFVARNEDFQEFVRDVALHIAAANPDFVSEEDVPEDVKQAEARIFEEQSMDKPDNVRPKIVEGRIRKWLEEVVLLNQEHVHGEKHDGKTIEQLRQDISAKTGENVVIRRFTRYQVGEE